MTGYYWFVVIAHVTRNELTETLALTPVKDRNLDGEQNVVLPAAEVMCRMEAGGDRHQLLPLTVEEAAAAFARYKRSQMKAEVEFVAALAGRHGQKTLTAAMHEAAAGVALAGWLRKMNPKPAEYATLGGEG